MGILAQYNLYNCTIPHTILKIFSFVLTQTVALHGVFKFYSVLKCLYRIPKFYLMS